MKGRFFKKYLKRRKSRAAFWLRLDPLHFNGKKSIKNQNSSGLGTCKVGKKVSFWPNFDFFCNIRAA